ncbi:Dihydroorotate dehydrogenase B (NAD(+)), catalytic subunit [Bhargavaea cecembensis DSE10]|uniref:Dihydroorotate dehydrogenase n=1 Tax=Bhargavaea cecembensis DSE10 TaxID=1235279 RepID=M7NHE1_9BACL|nr:dihydroorotate dehydrogenase [Bhargavaea cecembensis]EMR06606.1 Dihydroorotate dehydrogenase B (NAD(+)), catalytic subunit [Bhargavaea cecembensis DSE10]
MNMRSRNLEVKIGNLALANPIMPASGAFGVEMNQAMDFNRLGALVPKSITKYPRGGNPTPRVCEVTSGMINSIGIQSKGIDYYIKEAIPEYAQYPVPLISSISGDTVEEFVEMCQIIGNHPDVDAIELNISCPNLEHDGKAFGMDPDISYDLIKRAKQVTDVPLIAKLTPNVRSIQEIAIACENAGADALTVANTFLAMAIDIHTMKPKIGNIMGGISGPAVKPMIVRMIYQVYQSVDIPIIGCGGVMNPEDAIEMMVAGATAVQVGTASFINPNSMIEIIEGIEAYMIDKEIDDINELIGRFHADGTPNLCV